MGERKGVDRINVTPLFPHGRRRMLGEIYRQFARQVLADQRPDAIG